MEALRQETQPLSINDLQQLAADAPNHISAFGPETNLPGTATVPHPIEFAVSADLPEAQLSQPAALSDEIVPREPLATTLGPRAISLRGDWLRSIVLGASSSRAEATVANDEELTAAQAKDSHGTDEDDQGIDAPAEGDDEVVKAKDSSEEFQKFGSGGGGKKDCFGCGRRTRDRECSHCVQKHAPKPQVRTRGDHSDGTTAVDSTRPRGHNISPKESAASTWLSKLALSTK